MNRNEDGRGRRLKPYAVLAALALAASATLAACGGDDDDDGGAAAEGGEITISQTSQPDYLDPALSYTVNGIEPLWLVYTPLLTYPHVEGAAGAELIPGLAEDLPEISADGKTYTLTLRDGLKFSDGTAVKASDFEHTIKRVLNLESGGSAFYQTIEGATEYLEKGDPEGDISGIETNDQTGEITINLTEADASFSNILAMWFAGIVPSDTPFKNLTEDPPPGVGPFMITESVPNRQFVLEKNPEFEALNIPDIPVPALDKITTQIIKNASQQAQDVLDNKLDYMQDPPPADLKPTVIEQADDRYEEFATSSTYYFFMDSAVPPVRRPAGSRGGQLRDRQAGPGAPVRGRDGTRVLVPAPGLPRLRRGVRHHRVPVRRPEQPPDVAKAQDLIKQAGAEGGQGHRLRQQRRPDRQGHPGVRGHAQRDRARRRRRRSSTAASTSRRSATPRRRPRPGSPTGSPDFPHPLNFYFLVDGDSIQPTNNQNDGNVDDPKINDEIDRLSLETDTEAVATDWAELDRYLVEPPQSYVAPYGHRKLAKFMSERMDYDAAVFHPVYFNDYSTWALKEGE